MLPGLSEPWRQAVVILVGLLYIYYIYYIYSKWAADRQAASFPIVALTEDGLGPKESWFQQGQKTIKKGLKECNGRPFRVMTGTGPKVVLPNRFAEELKNRAELTHIGAFKKDFFVGYPGFEPFAESVIPNVIRNKLTPALGLIINDLVDETTTAIHDIVGDDGEWHEIFLKQSILQLVARLSARISLGLPLCRDKRWLELSKDYTVHAFACARELRQVPGIIRPFIHWFLPESTKLRRDYRDARKLITPEVEKLRLRAQKAAEAGKKPRKRADLIGWMYDLSEDKERMSDFVNGQLELALASIHTSTEAITSALLDIVAHPELVKPLRDEVIKALRDEGWTRAALYKMRLMDSFLKENQRAHPPNAISMNRLVKETVTLSDGSVLPAGTRFIVANSYDDPAVYESPEKFDAYRFLRKREDQGKMNAWQHVTLSPQHMAFGLGDHACPGRFFASNEIKIAIAQLLLKYDWEPTRGDQPGFRVFETNTIVNLESKCRIRRRKEEIVIDLPEPMTEQSLDVD
ncbi:cytochrome P450 [Diaporthe sp. PMI_573]|nr:cytochrome P450 [Diaporthaceae sp. PMI_573]